MSAVVSVRNSGVAFLFDRNTAEVCAVVVIWSLWIKEEMCWGAATVMLSCSAGSCVDFSCGNFSYVDFKHESVEYGLFSDKFPAHLLIRVSICWEEEEAKVKLGNRTLSCIKRPPRSQPWIHR